MFTHQTKTQRASQSGRSNGGHTIGKRLVCPRPSRASRPAFCIYWIAKEIIFVITTIGA